MLITINWIKRWLPGLSSHVPAHYRLTSLVVDFSHIFTRLIASTSNNICTKRVIFFFFVVDENFSIKLFCSTVFLLSTFIKIQSTFSFLLNRNEFSWSIHGVHLNWISFEGAGVVCRMQALKRKGRDCGNSCFITWAANCCEGWKCQTAPEVQAATIHQLLVHVNCIYLSL